MLRGRRYRRFVIAAMLACGSLASATGCHLILPDIGHQPMVHNPFPQLSRVAVAPFFNQSDEPTVDGRKFALAYFSELQAVPGFEVVPLGVVEEAILAHQVDLSHAGEARRLARILNVDVVVVGSITDYSSYYPPRCGLRIEWYAVNPGFHEIPPGYGLPWGTPEEEFIPEPLVFEAEMAMAKAELATQTPACELPPIEPPPQLMLPIAPPLPTMPPEAKTSPGEDEAEKQATPPQKETDSDTGAKSARYEESVAEEDLPPPLQSAPGSLPALQPDSNAATGMIGTNGANHMLPHASSEESSFIPIAPGRAQPPCVPNDGPVMTHTRIYHGHDSDFTAALANYYHFRNDARFGGWQNYLQRSDDFIRFCCHVHISEMLSARGGADKSRVVWRWDDCR